MNLYICSTYYHVLVTALKCIDSEDNNVIAVTGYIPSCDGLVERLRKSKIFSDVVFLPRIDPTNKFEYLHWLIVNNLRVKKLVQFDFTSFCNIYIFMDDICYARYFKREHIYYHIIEDGYDAFKKNKMQNSPFLYTVKKRDDWKSRVRNILFPFNSDNVKYYLDCKYVKSLEVNDKKDLIIDATDSRVKEVSKKNLFNKMNIENYKNVVLSIFLESLDIVNLKNMCIILTYCFFADKKIETIEAQTMLYKEVCDYYSELGLVPIIKPHPRDNVDYSSLKCFTLSKTFPAELISYLDQGRVKRYFSIFSSAVNSYEHDKVDFFDTIDAWKAFYKSYKSRT